jgi:hypothetical protein
LEKIYASKSLILSMTRDVSLFALSDLEAAAGIDHYNQTIGHRVWRGSAFPRMKDEIRAQESAATPWRSMTVADIP